MVSTARRSSSLMFWGFIVLMLALTVLFFGLGIWQLDRLAWKEGLIAAVASRMHEAPIPLPPVASWSSLDPDKIQYTPVSVTGHFVSGQTVRVFTSLDEPKGKYGSIGYWIMTPFAIDSGGTVFVNRGFVPKASGKTFTDAMIAPEGEATISGVLMPSQAAGSFTPAFDNANRIDWIRDISRLKAEDDPALAPVLDFYIDLPAGPPGTLPQGGETTVTFPNKHLGYAWTWFGFAIITPIMLIFWIVRQRRPKPDPIVPRAS